jgi:tetratricopeptide (TPR) repeat protein
MTSSLSAIEAPSTEEARRILRAAEAAPGTNKAFFERIVSLIGADPEEARKLASRWRIFAKYGDYDAYALRAKAVCERLDGKWLAAGQSFLKAGRRAESELEAAVFATGAVDSLARAGEVKRAISVGKRLAGRLDRMGEAGLAGRVRLNLGNALLHLDAYRRASTQFSKAAVDLAAAGYDREAAAAELGVSGALLFSGNVTRSMEAATAAATRFEELGDWHFGALARLNLAHGHLLQGRGDEALALLLQISPLLGSAADKARCEEFLGDAYIRLNLFEAAADAFAAALAMPGLKAMPLNHANCLFGAGLASLALGKRADARGKLKRAANRYKKLGNEAWAGAAVMAASACASPQQARRISAEAINLLRSSKSRYHLASALLERAERFDDRSDLKKAAKLISAHGYGFLRWRIDAAYARASSGKRRLGHYRKMFEGLMADRLLTRSTSARAAFLRDKQEPLSEFLGELLDSPAPLVEEAIAAVTRSRSVALIDELLAAQRPGLTEPAKAALEELRIAVAQEMDIGRSSGTRRMQGGAKEMARLQRRWLQTAFAQTVFNQSSVLTPNGGAAVYVATDRGYFALFEGRAIRIQASEDELRKMLKWFEFELLSPMVGTTDPDPVMNRIAALRSTLVAPLLLYGRPTAIVPDGTLWAAPWNLLLDRETPVLSNPVFQVPDTDSTPRKVVIWAHDPGGLTNLASEVEAVLEYWPRAKVVHDLESARKTLESSIDLLHVACHASSRSDNPMYSGLELEGGLLLATEIAKSPASIGQVTLSACDTGRVSTTVRSEPDGLVRSFQAAGASSVIASQWPLDDLAASITMRTYYRELAAGRTVMEALALARSACQKQFRHPYYWAPLTIFGGYRRQDDYQ